MTSPKGNSLGTKPDGHSSLLKHPIKLLLGIRKIPIAASDQYNERLGARSPGLLDQLRRGCHPSDTQVLTELDSLRTSIDRNTQRLDRIDANL
jgi:hypothetical protein